MDRGQNIARLQRMNLIAPIIFMCRS